VANEMTFWEMAQDYENQLKNSTWKSHQKKKKKEYKGQQEDGRERRQKRVERGSESEKLRITCAEIKNRHWGVPPEYINDMAFTPEFADSKMFDTQGRLLSFTMTIILYYTLSPPFFLFFLICM
jgi:hypothetical protein